MKSYLLNFLVFLSVFLYFSITIPSGIDVKIFIFFKKVSTFLLMTTKTVKVKSAEQN